MRNADFGVRNETNAECGFRSAEWKDVERGAKRVERNDTGIEANDARSANDMRSINDAEG